MYAVGYFVMAFMVASLVVIVIHQRRVIKRLYKEIANQPIGRIISSELTDDGLLVKGEIFSDEVWAKMRDDLPGMSIGYSVDVVKPFTQKPYEYGIDHATLFVEPEMTKLRSISLDKEPNAWGYSIHLVDCPAKDSNKLPAEGCTCTPIPTADGRLVPVSEWNKGSVERPPTTPDDIDYNTVVSMGEDAVLHHTYSPSCPEGCYGQLEECYYKKE